MASAKTLSVCDLPVTIFAIVETENLFVKVLTEMKRLYTNVSALQGAPEKRPEVFDAIRVNFAAHILKRMVHNVTHEVVAHLVIAHRIVGVHDGAVLQLYPPNVRR